MKTFETEKHNIPEGATHHGVYGCDTDCYFKKDGETYLLWKDENWSLSHFDHHGWVKPITQPTYRYEKVTTVFTLDRDLMHSGEYGECYKDDFYPAFNEVELVNALTKDKLYRRIEVTERELFIEEICKRRGWNVGSAAGSMVGDMYDAGCRFVNGKG